jgi:hypothetical protein
MDKHLTDHHNDGQQDCSEGNKYNEPNSFLDILFCRISDHDQLVSENDAYRDGWINADKQN